MSAADKLASVGTGICLLVALDIELRGGWEAEREVRERPRMVDGGGGTAAGAAAVRSAAEGRRRRETAR